MVCGGAVDVGLVVPEVGATVGVEIRTPALNDSVRMSPSNPGICGMRPERA